LSAGALFEYTLRLGDDALINGQRLSEWCGHGPFLEEDVGVANTALDLIGRARLLLAYAGTVEGRGRDEDDLAFTRDERDWRNVLITELPRGDFGFTTVRQFLLDAFNRHLYERLCLSRDETLAGIAGRAVKESEYHLRHTGEWVLRLGDGTKESHLRAQRALDELWPYTAEMFESDPVQEQMEAQGAAPATAGLQAAWLHTVEPLLRAAQLTIPENTWPQTGGRQGMHSEHMGFLLAEMQFLQRAYPGQTW
jgi:ring-1,2-phenylacetyl-CoA epoxidase subunit PaaC